MPESLPTKIAAQFAWAPIEAWVSSTASAADYAARAAAGTGAVGHAKDLPSSPVSRRFELGTSTSESIEWTQDLPGASTSGHRALFVHNELARGVLVVDGVPVKGSPFRRTRSHHAELGGELPRQTVARNRQCAGGRLQLAAEISYAEFDGSRDATPAVEDRHRDCRFAALEFVPRCGDLRQPDDREFLA